MKLIISYLLVITTLSACAIAGTNKDSKTDKNKTSKSNQPIAIAIHGGAGTILKANMTPERERAYRAKLTEALQAGYAVLKQGGTSVEAVQATIVVMEDSPLFNAGKGAVFTHHKTNELDVSIMEGKTLNAGAASGVTNVKNPIKLATEIMYNSEHVMLSGEGALAFAKKRSLEMVPSKYFFTKRRWDSLHKVLKEDPDSTISSEHKDDKDDKYSQTPPSTQSDIQLLADDYKFGTVGAVALDQDGNLAAGTSTGGRTNKKFGRIGDSPVIGAGTYADNQSGAISATGHGEYFIRAAVAHDICARVLYTGISLQESADQVIQDKLVKMGGTGGIVAMTPKGEPVFSFNTAGMYRGYIDSDGKVYVGIYKSN